MLTFTCIMLIAIKFKNHKIALFLRGGYDCVLSHDKNTIEPINELFGMCHNCTGLCSTNIYILCCLIYHCSILRPCVFRDTKLPTFNWLQCSSNDIVYTKLPYGKQLHPLVTFNYDSQTKSTIIYCSSAKTIYLLIAAWWASLKPIVWDHTYENKYHSSIMKLYNPHLEDIQKHWERNYNSRTDNLYLIGHSLGGAGAAYLAYFLRISNPDTLRANNTHVLLTGSIKCSDEKFAETYHQLVPNTVDIKQNGDNLQYVPWSIVHPFCHLNHSKCYHTDIQQKGVNPHDLRLYIEACKKNLSINLDDNFS